MPECDLDRPRLRPLSAERFDHQGQPFAALADPLGAFDDRVLVPLPMFLHVVRHLDGRTTLADVQARVLRETGQLLRTEDLRRLVEQLDAAMVIDGPSFRAFVDEYRRQRLRPAVLAGRSYPATERALRAHLARLFVHESAAGPPTPAPAEGPAAALRGVISPHIDFQRGGPVYTWAYRELVEKSDAEVFVILGVAHSPCARRFALTRKDFATPLGTAPTDQDFVDQLADLAGSDLFDDELAHRGEHSVEFQVVFLQYVMGDRPFSIVPILVGSFHDLMAAGIDPIDDPQVRRFVEALRQAEAESGRKVAYVGGIDLGHVGREFGDADLLDDPTLDGLRAFDRGMIDRAEAADPAGWFATAAAVGDRWRVCGLAATYTMLHAIGPARGRLLRYDQAVDAARTCCVSFASLAFDEAAELVAEGPDGAKP